MGLKEEGEEGPGLGLAERCLAPPHFLPGRKGPLWSGPGLLAGSRVGESPKHWVGQPRTAENCLLIPPQAPWSPSAPRRLPRFFLSQLSEVKGKRTSWCRRGWASDWGVYPAGARQGRALDWRRRELAAAHPSPPPGPSEQQHRSSLQVRHGHRRAAGWATGRAGQGSPCSAPWPWRPAWVASGATCAFSPLKKLRTISGGLGGNPPLPEQGKYARVQIPHLNLRF